MSEPEPETWWVLRPFPRRVRIALWVGGIMLGASYLVFSFVPVTRRLIAEGASEIPARDFAVFLLGLAIVGFFALIAAGVWVFLKIQGEFQKLREEDRQA